MSIRRADSATFKEGLDAFRAEQKAALQKALVEHAGNVLQTALALDLSRTQVNRLIDEHELRSLAVARRGRPVGTSKKSRKLRK